MKNDMKLATFIKKISDELLKLSNSIERGTQTEEELMLAMNLLFLAEQFDRVGVTEWEQLLGKIYREQQDAFEASQC